MKQCCIDGCTNECMPNRRYCKTHFREKEREGYHRRFLNGYRKPPRTYVCEICGVTFVAKRGPRRFCDACLAKRREKLNDSKYTATRTNCVKFDTHRKIDKDLGVLPNGRNDVVHHIDGNKQNNTRENLVVLSLQDHGKLHSFISDELLKNPNQSISELTWTYINNNGVPFFHCSDNPEDLEIEARNDFDNTNLTEL